MSSRLKLFLNECFLLYYKPGCNMLSSRWQRTFLFDQIESLKTPTATRRAMTSDTPETFETFASFVFAFVATTAAVVAAAAVDVVTFVAAQKC